MSTDLERRLRQALHDDAQRARLVNPDQPPTPDMAVVLSDAPRRARSGHWLVAVAAAVTLIAAAAGVVLVQIGPDRPSEMPTDGSGLIALAGSGGSGYADIYVVAPDGTGLRALTSTPGVHETAPAWSPDGTRLAFLRNLWSGSGELVVIDPATGDETFSADVHPAELDPPGGIVRDVMPPPEWSPDGRLIALNLGNCGCFVMVDLETGTWTTISGGAARGWSPDGKWFAFAKPPWEGQPGGLFLVPADLLGTTDLDDVPNLPGVRLLAESYGLDGLLGGVVSWMPDSSAVAIETTRGSIDVVTIADGRRRTLIEHGEVPSWSPDGSHLAYMRCADERDDSVWVAAADGTGAREVATSYVAPTWSPGGRVLTVVGADGVFTVRPDGTGMTQLAQITRTGGRACLGLDSFRPVWQPGATEAAPTDATQTKTTEAPVTTQTPD